MGSPQRKDGESKRIPPFQGLDYFSFMHIVASKWLLPKFEKDVDVTFDQFYLQKNILLRTQSHCILQKFDMCADTCIFVCISL